VACCPKIGPVLMRVFHNEIRQSGDTPDGRQYFKESLIIDGGRGTI
jgi:hypothetical protein